MNGKDILMLIRTEPEKGHRVLFDEYKNYVYTIVYNRLRSVTSREDIEECVSDVFAEICIGIENLCTPLSESEEHRIFSKMEKKYRSISRKKANDYSYSVSGVEHYIKPPLYRRAFAIAAAMVIIAGIAYGAYSFEKPDTKNENITESATNISIELQPDTSFSPLPEINVPRSDEPIIYGNDIRNFDNGGVYTINSQLKKSMYIDYRTMEKFVLCAVPGCTHSNSLCPSQNAEDPVIYGNNVYYFTHYEITGYNHGVPYMTMSSRLIRTSLNSFEPETVCSFTDAIPRKSTMILIGSKLYFSAYDPDVDDVKHNSLSNKSGGGYEYLCSIDLDSGEYRNYGSICYVENEYKNADNSSFSALTGAADGKIYITYEFMKDQAEKDFTYYCFEFDTKTEKYARSGLPALLYAENELYVWLDTDSHKLHIMKSGKQYEFDYPYYTSSVKSSGDKLFLVDRWISLDDMKMHSLGNSSGKMIAAYYDGCYIISDVYYINFEKLTEQELLALDKKEE